MQLKLVLVLAAVTATTSTTTLATTVTFATPAAAAASGLPVKAEATFVTNAGQLTITVLNDILDPKSVVQNISDIELTLSIGNLNDLKKATLTASSGVERTIGPKGVFSDGGSVSTGWTLSTSTLGSADALHLDVLGTSVAPAHTIVGLPNAKTDQYNNANSSIAGNQAHNPFLSGPVVFHLDTPFVTETTYVTAARFSFGTSSGLYATGTIVEPEVSTWAMFASGLGLIVSRSRRR